MAALPAIEPGTSETPSNSSTPSNNLNKAVENPKVAEGESSEAVLDGWSAAVPSENGLDRRSSLLKKHLARSISRSQSGATVNGDHATDDSTGSVAQQGGRGEETNGWDEAAAKSDGRGAAEDLEGGGEESGFGRAEERSFGRAFKELFRKRAIIARRDLKGMANSILLPVVVIAFVLLILKLNIDPAVSSGNIPDRLSCILLCSTTSI